MTLTAALFPGLNTLFRPGDRRRYLDVPEVSARLAQLRDTPFRQDVDSCATELMHSRRYCSLAAITMAIQCGLFQHLCQRGETPGILVGCSLGDLARNVCCASISYDSALDTLHALAPWMAELEPFGEILSIRLRPGQDIQAAAEQLAAGGVETSILSRKRINIGCSKREGLVVRSLSNENGWTCEDTGVYFPLHSHHVRTLAERAWQRMDVSFSDPAIPVYSAVQLKRLSRAEDICDDGKRALYQPVQWLRTLERMRAEEGVSDFVDIGPCRSLTMLARESDRRLSVRPIAA